MVPDMVFFFPVIVELLPSVMAPLKVMSATLKDKGPFAWPPLIVNASTVLMPVSNWTSAPAATVVPSLVPVVPKELPRATFTMPALTVVKPL